MLRPTVCRRSRTLVLTLSTLCVSSILTFLTSTFQYLSEQGQDTLSTHHISAQYLLISPFNQDTLSTPTCSAACKFLKRTPEFKEAPFVCPV
eukprot:1149232-Pelagomonas_calceolata.AAC.1